PNIWLAEKLKATFRDAFFVGIERNPYATVASMLRHGGVSAWHTRWCEFPVPNRFLGITPELAKRYDTIPRAAQCATRWLAHRDQMNALRLALGSSLMVISYETFADGTAEIIRELEHFLGLAAPIPVPQVQRDSLHKWQSQLSADEVHQIQSV